MYRLTQVTQTPSPTALQTALGAASTLAGIYRAFNPTQAPAPVINIGGKVQ